MNLIFFDERDIRTNLLPLTFTRPVADVRVGILTIRQKWEKRFGVTNSSSVTEDYLSEKFPVRKGFVSLIINGAVLPDEELVQELLNVPENGILLKGDLVIGGKSSDPLTLLNSENIASRQYAGEIRLVRWLWDIFSMADVECRSDFKVLTEGRKSEPISSTNTLIGKESEIFLETGAIVEGAYLNSASGPIYIAKDAEVMEGTMIRGPFGLGEHSQLKMGAKIYGATSIGPYCKVGGEINNSVFFGYSNKAHDGFLGNAVIGEWCNIGADSNNSNLKNNYAIVKLWHYGKRSFIDTGLQFCGLVMGDHSKCGINTMFNTGTVIGVSANIFGSGFPRNFIPSFSWGGPAGISPYKLGAAIETAQRVFERRGKEFNETEQAIFRKLYELSQPG